MPERTDVVVCGGGIAGGAIAAGLARRGISVLVLEQQAVHRDMLRGEMLSPWGIHAAAELGVDDLVYAPDPEPLTQWVQWDECHDRENPPVVDLTRRFVPGVPAPLAIRYYATAAALVDGARAAGAEVVMGARDIRVAKGTPPTVRYVHDGAEQHVTPRVVIGAGGRNGPIGRQVGLELDVDVHHWGAGLVVSGMDDWPTGVHAMGTEGHRMFFVFPQGNGRTRLYFNFAKEHARRYAGPSGARVFLDDFALTCLPPELSAMCVSATPLGGCGSTPAKRTRLAQPFTDGVVLIGDEAGANDSVLGTGLSCAFDDARRVAELLAGNTRWDGALFEHYQVARAERQRKLFFAAEIFTKLFCEFGPEATERRRRAFARMNTNANYTAIMLTPMAGPDRTPPFAFSDFTAEKLFAPDPPRSSSAAKRRFALTG